MALSDKFRLLSPHYVERPIGDETFRFYPNSVRVAARLSEVISELTGHFSVIFANTDRDTGSTHEEVTGPGGELVKTTEVQPINPDLLEVRLAKRQKAVQGAISALMNPKYRLVIGELLMDSMRDEFPRGKPRDANDAQDLVDGLEIPTLIEFIQGLAQANAKVFGDLGKAVKDALGTQLGAVLGAVEREAEPATAG